MNGDSLTLTLILYGRSTQGMMLLLEALVYPILKHLPERTHYGIDVLMGLIRPHFKSIIYKRPFGRLSKPVRYASKMILRENVFQQEREYNIKGYAHLRSGKLTLHRYLKP